MSRLEKVKIDKVWGDEIFYTTNTITGVEVTAPDDITFTDDSTITGTAQVAVTNCTLSEVGGVVTATVEYMVQEELTVQINEEPGSDDFNLEYDYRFTRDFEFQKLVLPDDINIANLDCVVFRSTGAVLIKDLDLGETSGTFDNDLNVMTKLKVIEAIQTFVTLGTPPYVVTATVTVVPNE